jgi:hypothetical protein
MQAFFMSLFHSVDQQTLSNNLAMTFFTHAAKNLAQRVGQAPNQNPSPFHSDQRWCAMGTSD